MKSTPSSHDEAAAAEAAEEKDEKLPSVERQIPSQPNQLQIQANASSATMKVMLILLQANCELLDVRELGALSSCNKTMQQIFEPRWKQIWEEYAGIAAKEYVVDWRGLRTFEHEVIPIAYTTWIGESSVLPCFIDRNLAATCRGGYKHAAGCLRSKTCFLCQNMASYAHPLTLTRICKSCAQEDKQNWIVSKGKAKDAFLLGEADVRSLRGASVPSETISGAPATSIYYLLSDVMQASLEKHGGEDGLEAAFEAKKSKALEKFWKTQATDKPQKKKPKVTRASSRPCDRLEDAKRCVFVGNKYFQITA